MISVVVVALVLAGDAAARPCAGAEPRVRLDSADAAFIGRVAEVRRVPTGDGGPELAYVFRVDSVVKGDLDRRVEVTSPIGGANRPFDLRRDEASGILLLRDTNRDLWKSGICGQIAVGELIAAAEGTEESILNWGGGVVGSAILALGALLTWRRLRAKRYRPAP